VVDYRCDLEVGGVWIRPGDLVFGDLDGVVVVPQELETDVVTQALEKARAEKTVRAAIENGMSATEAFSTYGVL
jgi:regulator of RNase E activity RraA